MTTTLANLNSFALQSAEIVDDMKFDFLFDDQRKIFSIGYNVDLERRDNSFYDLLASEARLTSFVAIAKDEISRSIGSGLADRLHPLIRAERSCHGRERCSSI